MWNDRRWRTGLLTVSLLLNVFFVGIIAGRLWAAPSPPMPRHGDFPVVLLSNVKTLPIEQRKLFNTTMANNRDAIRAARQDQHRLKLMAEADMAAETFDASKVTADLTALRTANLAVQTAANTALIQALGTLTPEARAMLVNGEFRSSSPVN